MYCPFNQVSTCRITIVIFVTITILIATNICIVTNLKAAFLFWICSLDHAIAILLVLIPFTWLKFPIFSQVLGSLSLTLHSSLPIFFKPSILFQTGNFSHIANVNDQLLT